MASSKTKKNSKLDDDGILSGLGFHTEINSFTTLHDDILEPSATSTGTVTKMRDEEDLLGIMKTSARKQKEEDSLDLKSLRSNQQELNHNVPLKDVDALISCISPPKTAEERLLEARSLAEFNFNKRNPHIENVKLAPVINSSCIDVDNMSDLATNTFLLNESLKQKLTLYKTAGLPSILLSNAVGEETVADISSLISPWASEASSTLAPPEQQDSIMRVNGDDQDKITLGQQIEFSLDDLTKRSSTFANSSEIQMNAMNETKNNMFHFQLDPKVGSFYENSILKNQGDLGSILDETAFKTFDASQFKEVESTFDQNDSCSGKGFQGPDLSGSCNPSSSVSVRTSWLEQMPKDQFQPGEKISIEEMFKAKSFKLGSLEQDDSSEKPSFGFGTIITPPKSMHFDDSSRSSLTTSSTSTNSTKEFTSSLNEDISEKKKPDELLQVENNSSEGLLKILQEASKYKDPQEFFERVLQSRLQLQKDESSVIDTSQEVTMLKDFRQHISQPPKCNRENKPPTNMFNAPLPLVPERDVPQEPKLSPKKILQEPNRPTRFRMGTSSLHGAASSNKTTGAQLTGNLSASMTTTGQSIQKDQVSVPSSLSFPKPSIVGLRSEINLDIVNPSTKVAHLNMKDIQETLNSKLLQSSFLKCRSVSSFNAKSCSQITFYLFPLKSGSYRAQITLILSEVSSGKILVSKRILISAEICNPELEIKCEEQNFVDFGFLPEKCKIQKKISIVNKCSRSLPVILSITKIFQISQAFVWSSKESNSDIHIINPTTAAVELPESEDPIYAWILFEAPFFEHIEKADPSKVSSIGTEMVVTLDNPCNDHQLIHMIPIKAQVGELRLTTVRSEIPMEIHSTLNQTTTKTLKINNQSLFAITLKCGIESRCFTVDNQYITICSNQEGSILVHFHPDTPNKRDGILEIEVQPEGIDLDIALKGVVTSPPKKKRPDESVSIINSCRSSVGSSSVEKNPPNQVQNSRRKKKAMIDCNCLAIVFGAVAVNETSIKQIKLVNKWMDEPISFSLTFDEECFMIEGEKEITFKPMERKELTILFRPRSVRLYNGNLVMTYSYGDRYNAILIEIRGVGGCGKLEFVTRAEPTFLDFGKITRNEPKAIFNKMKNTGERPVFVRLRPLLYNSDHDRLESEVFSLEHMEVTPKEAVILPNATKDVVCVVFGTPTMMAKAQKRDPRIAKLQIIYGQEILRQSLKRNKEVEGRTRKITDASVLKIKWTTNFPGEEELSTAPEQYKFHPEDVTAFYNHCHTSYIDLHGEANTESEISSFFSIEAEEVTNSSNESHSDNDEQLTSKQQSHLPRVSETFGIYPPSINLNTTNQSYQSSIVNYTPDDQVIEVVWDEPWLLLEPRMIKLPKSSFSILKANIDVTKLPVSRPTLEAVVQIMGENSCREFIVSYEQLPIPFAAQREDYEKSTRTQDVPKRLLPSPSECKVKLISHQLQFPITKINKESSLCIEVQNEHKCAQPIKIHTNSQHFLSKYKEVELKSRRRVRIPVIFKPLLRGKYSDSLQITIVSFGNKELLVKLIGQAV